MKLNSKKLKELVEESIELKATKKRVFAELNTVKDILVLARENGHSFKEITAMVNEAGLELSVTQVNQFFKEVVQEPAKFKRRKKKKKDTPKKEVPARTSSKFRVAQDDL